MRYIRTKPGFRTFYAHGSFASVNNPTTMSTAKLILLLFLAGILTIVCPVAFAKDSQASVATTVTFEESFLDLSGIMTINAEKVSDYSVYIFQDGSPSDTFQVNNRLEQHFLLPLGHNYALKFSKPGCKERILLVNTFVNEKRAHEMYTFRYEIEFIENGESNTFDDFPVAHIGYDTKKKDFDYNRTYHHNVRTDIQPSESTTASKSWH
jgi:hypothetical protein